MEDASELREYEGDMEALPVSLAEALTDNVAEAEGVVEPAAAPLGAAAKDQAALLVFWIGDAADFDLHFGLTPGQWFEAVLGELLCVFQTTVAGDVDEITVAAFLEQGDVRRGSEAGIKHDDGLMIGVFMQIESL